MITVKNDNKTGNINVKSCSLSAIYSGDMKAAKVTSGDIRPTHSLTLTMAMCIVSNNSIHHVCCFQRIVFPL